MRMCPTTNSMQEKRFRPSRIISSTCGKINNLHSNNKSNFNGGFNLAGDVYGTESRAGFNTRGDVYGTESRAGFNTRNQMF